MTTTASNGLAKRESSDYRYKPVRLNIFPKGRIRRRYYLPWLRVQDNPSAGLMLFVPRIWFGKRTAMGRAICIETFIQVYDLFDMIRRGKKWREQRQKLADHNNVA